MSRSPSESAFKLLSRAELDLLSLDIIRKLQATYEPGQDRVVTPENVFQPAVEKGRDDLEAFQERLLLPGSRVEGLEHLEHCLGEMDRGRRIVFLPEHRGNLDVPSFNVLLRREHPRFGRILEKLVYIAGRKLNESSDLIKMFTEKYSRLVIVPKRDYPPEQPDESEAERRAREAFEKEAGRINRAAFRAMEKLKKAGYIFVLFPMGGRLRTDRDNVPVKESASYLRTFDTAYPISMEGNTLPPRDRMEDERPIQERVIFRVGAPVDCAAFLEAQREAFRRMAGEAEEIDGVDADQFTVNAIMRMLTALRETGRYPS